MSAHIHNEPHYSQQVSNETEQCHNNVIKFTERIRLASRDICSLINADTLCSYFQQNIAKHDETVGLLFCMGMRLWDVGPGESVESPQGWEVNRKNVA